MLKKDENIATPTMQFSLVPTWSISDFLINIFLPAKNRQYMKMLYRYIRWVDDTIDESDLSHSEKIEFIEKQIEMLKKYYNDSSVSAPNRTEELFLYNLVNYDKENNSNLFLPFKMMLDIFKFDANRQGQRYIPNENELDSYFSKIGEGAMRLTNGIAFPHVVFSDDSVYLLGKASEIAHMLRDFNEDVRLGIINVSKKDMVFYNLEIDTLHSDLLREWVEDKITSCWQLFEAGSKAIDQVPSTTARLAWRLFAAKYKIILLRLKAKDEEIFSLFFQSLKLLLREIKLSVQPKRYINIPINPYDKDAG